MKNDNSYNFWLNYYENNFKKWCELMLHNYRESLMTSLNELKENYTNRTDKESNNPIIKDSVTGQLNQIKAIETILQ